MKRILKWAEDNLSADQLALIGWGPKSPPKALEAPGQCGEFELASINGNVIEFDWKQPKTGGKPSGYKLFRRAPGGDHGGQSSNHQG